MNEFQKESKQQKLNLKLQIDVCICCIWSNHLVKYTRYSNQTETQIQIFHAVIDQVQI